MIGETLCYTYNVCPSDLLSRELPICVFDEDGPSNTLLRAGLGCLDCSSSSVRTSEIGSDNVSDELRPVKASAAGFMYAILPCWSAVITASLMDFRVVVS